MWEMFVGDAWEAVYWIRSCITADGRATVHRTITNLGPELGTVWEGVDCFVVSGGRRIVHLDSHDNRLATLIE